MIYRDSFAKCIRIILMARARKYLPIIGRIVVFTPMLLLFISRAEAAKWEVMLTPIIDYGSLGKNKAATKFYEETGPGLGWNPPGDTASHWQNNFGGEAMLRVNKFGIGYYTSVSLLASAGNDYRGTMERSPGYNTYCYSSYGYTECHYVYDPGGEDDYYYTLNLPAIKSAMVMQFPLCILADPPSGQDGAFSLELGYGQVKLMDGAGLFSHHSFSGGDAEFSFHSKAAPLYIIGLDLSGPITKDWTITIKLAYHRAKITDIYSKSKQTGASFRLKTNDGDPVSADYSGFILAIGGGYRFGF